MKPLDKALIVLSVLVALFAAQHLYALSCQSMPTETAELELDSVEVDGEPAQDPSAYDGYDVSIAVGSYAPEEVILRVESARPDDLSYLHRVHRQDTPSEE